MVRALPRLRWASATGLSSSSSRNGLKSADVKPFYCCRLASLSHSTLAHIASHGLCAPAKASAGTATRRSTSGDFLGEREVGDLAHRHAPSGLVAASYTRLAAAGWAKGLPSSAPNIAFA